MFGWRYRRARRTTLISFGCLAFLSGVALANVSLFVPTSTAVGSLLLLVCCVRRRILLAVPAALVVGLVLGLWRGGELHHRLSGYQEFFETKVTVQGVVREDTTYGDKGQLDFRIGEVLINGQWLPGQVRVTTFDPVEPRRGDTIQAVGKLRSGFGNYQAGMYFAKVSLARQTTSPVEQLRRTYSAAVLNVIPEPQASLGLGFLLGIKSQLPEKLDEQLKILGLTHIVVASGYNLTILVRAARRGFAKRSKYQATLAAVALLIGFVLVTGFSPSMTRAALVTALALTAWYYGRVIHPVVLLLFAAAVTAAVNPLYVWGDIGWYLSFLAFGGVMLGAPLLQKRFFGDKKVPQLVQICFETICAQLMTLPLILFIFGDFSVLALLANLLIVPLIPLAMIAAFIAGLASMLLPGFGGWLAVPATWLLGYMTELVQNLSAIPWAQVPLHLAVGGMVALYGCIGLVGLILYKKTRHNYLRGSIIE